jgi:hypothetical protein
MSSKIDDFTDALIRVLPYLSEVHQRTVDYWSPDEPPVTILFADLGRAISDGFEGLDEKKRVEIFELIESGINSDDEVLGTAVATGLIEAMLGRAYRINIWGKMEKYFIGSSKRHAQVWMGP